MSAHAGWQFCPRCSVPLRSEGSRVTCSACDFVHYANSTPAASAFVRDESGRVLLARRAHEPDAGLWDSPGGFLDEGEHPAAGLRRELLEETGLEIEVGEFVGAFMDTYGDDPDAVAVLNLVWEARVVAGDPSPADDVSELRWFDAGALPPNEELAFRWLAPALRAWAASDGRRPRAEPRPRTRNG